METGGRERHCWEQWWTLTCLKSNVGLTCITAQEYLYLVLNVFCKLLPTVFFFLSLYLFLFLILMVSLLIFASGFFPDFSRVLTPPLESSGRNAALKNTFLYFSEFLQLVKQFSSFFADSEQMTAKNILCGLANDKFGFQYFKLKPMLKISRVNICDKQVIFNNIRQFLFVENYYSLISNQPPL